MREEISIEDYVDMDDKNEILGQATSLEEEVRKWTVIEAFTKTKTVEYLTKYNSNKNNDQNTRMTKIAT